MYNVDMILVWDEAKRQANLKKHRMDFKDAERVFDSVTFTFEDNRFDYGEQHFITIGLLNDQFIIIAHAEDVDDNDLTRVISMRKATKYEQKLFFQAFRN